MNLKPLASKLKKAAPFILSALSVVGVVATAILSAKATAKALEEVEERDDTWKCYIPTALTVIATAACIIGNGVLNHKQQASLIAAYTLLEKSYRQYRGKAKEIYGEDANRKIVSAMALEKTDPETVVYTPGIFDSMCLDWGTDEQETRHHFYIAWGNGGRHFESTISRVLQAEMAVAHNVGLGAFVSVNDFFTFLGLKAWDGCDSIGWCVCGSYLAMEFDHHREFIDDGLEGENECLVIDFPWLPETEEELGIA